VHATSTAIPLGLYPILEIPDVAASRYSASVPLLTDLDAFYLEHRGCGELDAGVEDDHVWMTCTCGARIMRPIHEQRT